MFEQAFMQVGQISVRIAVGSYALVDLENVNSGPRYIFVRQGSQHDPRGMAPLTAMMNRPRAATASRASWAMMAAAFPRQLEGRQPRQTSFQNLQFILAVGLRPHFSGFSKCPPNWKRIAESSLLA